MNVFTRGWLTQHAAPTTVILRRKRDGEVADRIVSELGKYFLRVAPAGSAVEITVDARAVGPPALRVAAILDGIDARWEEFFHLPIPLMQGPSLAVIDGDA